MSELLSSCDRRTFVGLCTAAALGSTLSACAALVVRPVTPVNGRIALSFAHYPELNEPGAALKLQPAGSTEPVYVLAQPDGSFAALSPICTHLGCTVEIQGARLVCPCHGSTYDRSGNVLQGPAQRALGRYRVERTPDGVLLIDLASRT